MNTRNYSQKGSRQVLQHGKERDTQKGNKCKKINIWRKKFRNDENHKSLDLGSTKNSNQGADINIHVFK